MAKRWSNWKIPDHTHFPFLCQENEPELAQNSTDFKKSFFTRSSLFTSIKFIEGRDCILFLFVTSCSGKYMNVERTKER